MQSKLKKHITCSSKSFFDADPPPKKYNSDFLDCWLFFEVLAVVADEDGGAKPSTVMIADSTLQQTAILVVTFMIIIVSS